ncbi:MAG: DEAD/DEAH box helicase [Betaproteobacteria bacterium]|nr:DEAD/DEAH box helicase [Betaproteobacteria bacterium]
MTQLFSDLGLSVELTRAVSDQGYTEPTPVQAKTIPIVLQGRDLLAAAQTGTGKTGGFALPILHRLAANMIARTPKRVRVLVLTPTRELAAQVDTAFKGYGRHLRLNSTAVYGGVSIGAQIQALKRGVEILVATPGRLLDHVQQRTVDLSRVEIVVLDEADRMLDMGFIHDIRRILSLLPKPRQSLLFSATFSNEIRTLANTLLSNPAVIEIERHRDTSDLIKQRVHPVAVGRKRELLAHLVTKGDWQQVLVFTKTKHGANRLAEQLEKQGINSATIHANKSQSQRTRALAEFKRGDVRVLVATDIAARGLDIEALPHVVNFDLPNAPEDYVHRIGRTGRAGMSGEAISFVAPDERRLLTGIERLIARRIDSEVVPGFEVAAHEKPSAERRPQIPRSNQPRKSSRGAETRARSGPTSIIRAIKAKGATDGNLRRQPRP